MKMRSLIIYFICITTTILVPEKNQAQIFTDVAAEIGVKFLNGTSYWGNGLSFFDVDEDGWDDLTFCIAGSSTRYYRNVNGTYVFQHAFSNSADSKACMWFDYDEDGDNDLLVTRRDAPTQLWQKIEGGYQDVSSQLNLVYNASNWSWGVACGDLNRDAYLDVYIANYGSAFPGARNTILTNTTLGGFSSLISYGATLSFKRTFQPVFLDLNNDQVQEIYVTNDFSAVNEYYVRTEPYLFVDQAASKGLNVAVDAMSNAWADFDRDNDEDLYISNTPTTLNRLMQNTSGYFSNVAPSRGLNVGKWCWSTLWFDLDNNTWEDLIVTERNISVSANFSTMGFSNANGYFSPFSNTALPNLPAGYFCAAKGDFNNDGKYDVMLSPETSQFSVALKNNTPSGNYLKFSLRGRVSNRNGFGTHYSYYMNGQEYSGYTYSSDNYLNQNSQNIILGMGVNTIIDSLVLNWQNGVNDRFYNLQSNSSHVFVEGETWGSINQSKLSLCGPNDSLTLSIEDWPLVTWNTGESTHSIQVNASGTYTATVSTGFGHSLQFSKTITQTSEPLYNAMIQSPLCSNDEFGIAVIMEDSIQIAFLDSLIPGTHTYISNYGIGCIAEIPFVVNMPPAPITYAIQTNPLICENEAWPLTIELNGGTGDYTWINYSYGELLGEGNYNVVIQDSANCELSVPIAVTAISEPSFVSEVNAPHCFQGGDISIALNDSWQESILWENGNTDFFRNELAPGTYSCFLTDTNACQYEYSFVIDSIVELQLEVLVNEPICYLETGSIEIYASGGDLFSNFELNQQLLNDLPSGNYSGTFTDSLGCSVAWNATIPDVNPMVYDYAIQSASSQGLGSIEIFCDSTYSISWDNGVLGPFNPNLVNGNYAVVIADPNDCSVDTVFTVLFNEVLNVDVQNEFWLSNGNELIYKGNRTLHDVLIFDRTGRILAKKSVVFSGASFHFEISTKGFIVHSAERNFIPKSQIE